MTCASPDPSFTRLCSFLCTGRLMSQDRIISFPLPVGGTGQRLKGGRKEVRVFIPPVPSPTVLAVAAFACATNAIKQPIFQGYCPCPSGLGWYPFPTAACPWMLHHLFLDLLILPTSLFSPFFSLC